MADPGGLVLLTTCADSAEAGALRARLEAEGIRCVIQGEQHRAMLGTIFGSVIEIRVMVAADVLERARTLLEAWQREAEAEGPPPLAAVGEGGRPVCPDHGAPSVGTCTRCGAFVCEACAAGAGQAVLCLRCEERAEREAPPSRSSRRRLYGWLAIGILFGLPAAGLAIALVRALFGGG